MIPSRQALDLLCGHWTLLSRLGATPKALVWDNESAVGQWRGGRPQLTEAMNGFRGTLGVKVIQCRPADPESKGLVERANGYGDVVSAWPHVSRLRPISTFSWRTGWGGRIGVSIGFWGVARSTVGTPTGPRCWPCHQSPRPSAGS
jgi:hypothetical protein